MYSEGFIFKSHNLLKVIKLYIFILLTDKSFKFIRVDKTYKNLYNFNGISISLFCN